MPSTKTDGKKHKQNRKKTVPCAWKQDKHSHCMWLINPPMTARVKISQNFDFLAKVYLVHLKVEHCQTLCSKYTGQNYLIVFDSCIVEAGQNGSKNQSKMTLCAHLGQKSTKRVNSFIVCRGHQTVTPWTPRYNYASGRTTARRATCGVFIRLPVTYAEIRMLV